MGSFPVVVLTGPRQTGKTTLAQWHGIGGERTYLTLDDFDTLDAAKRDPSALLGSAERITLDEIQRTPDLIPAIKVAVDRGRRAGRFLCTGSANLLRMRQVAESLAGRAVYLDLPPLTWAELERRAYGRVLEVALSSSQAENLLRTYQRSATFHATMPLSEAVFRSRLPVSALTRDPVLRARWLEGYVVAAYLERDLRQLSPIGDLVAFRRFMQSAALRNGSMLNLTSIAQDAGLPPTTASRYLSRLELSLLVRRLPPYTVNRGKRLSKTPKLFWSDSGLAAHLAGFSDASALAKDRPWGAWLESWVGHHLHTWASLRSPRPQLCYWRTSAGAEVDFIIESGRTLLPIEVKSTERPVGKDIAGLESFLDLYPGARVGLLACLCDAPRLMSRRILAVPIEELLLGGNGPEFAQRASP